MTKARVANSGAMLTPTVPVQRGGVCLASLAEAEDDHVENVIQAPTEVMMARQQQARANNTATMLDNVAFVDVDDDVDLDEAHDDYAEDDDAFEDATCMSTSSSQRGAKSTVAHCVRPTTLQHVSNTPTRGPSTRVSPTPHSQTLLSPDEKISKEAREYWATIDLYNNSKLAFTKRLRSVRLKREKLNAETLQRRQQSEAAAAAEQQAAENAATVVSATTTQVSDIDKQRAEYMLCTCVKCSIVYHEALIKGVTDIHAIMCTKCSLKLINCKCCSGNNTHISQQTMTHTTSDTTSSYSLSSLSASLSAASPMLAPSSGLSSSSPTGALCHSPAHSRTMSPSLSSDSAMNLSTCSSSSTVALTQTTKTPTKKKPAMNDEFKQFEDKLFHIKNELVSLSETSLDVFHLLLQLSDTMLELNTQISSTSTNVDTQLSMLNQLLDSDVVDKSTTSPTSFLFDNADYPASCAESDTLSTKASVTAPRNTGGSAITNIINILNNKTGTQQQDQFTKRTSPSSGGSSCVASMSQQYSSLTAAANATQTTHKANNKSSKQVTQPTSKVETKQPFTENSVPESEPFELIDDEIKSWMMMSSREIMTSSSVSSSSSSVSSGCTRSTKPFAVPSIPRMSTVQAECLVTRQPLSSTTDSEYIKKPNFVSSSTTPAIKIKVKSSCSSTSSGCGGSSPLYSSSNVDLSSATSLLLTEQLTYSNSSTDNILADESLQSRHSSSCGSSSLSGSDVAQQVVGCAASNINSGISQLNHDIAGSLYLGPSNRRSLALPVRGDRLANTAQIPTSSLLSNRHSTLIKAKAEAVVASVSADATHYARSNSINYKNASQHVVPTTSALPNRKPSFKFDSTILSRMQNMGSIHKTASISKQKSPSASSSTSTVSSSFDEGSTLVTLSPLSETETRQSSQYAHHSVSAKRIR